MKISSQSEPGEKYLTLAEFEKFKQALEIKLATKEDLFSAINFKTHIVNQINHIKTKLGI